MEDWRIGKNVTLTIILALALQIITFINYMSDLDNAVTINSKDIANHSERLVALETSVQSQAISLARIDENIGHIRVAVDRVLESQPN